MILNIFLLLGFICLFLYIALKFIQHLFLKRKHNFLAKLSKNAQNARAYKLFGFFHPYCNAGGGGERVLWSSIAALQKAYEDSIKCIVYTGDTDDKREAIISRIKDRFNISLKYTDEDRLIFIYITQRRWVEAEMYPRFTMLGQSLGSMWLVLEAMWKCVPDIYIDTMGYAFTYPIVKYFCGCKIGCYVHYPTISTDMFKWVSESVATYNNNSGIASSPFLSRIKVEYYRLFAKLYGLVGRQSDVVMVNSTWTDNHIQQIWKVNATIVYPPCNVDEFLKTVSLANRDNSVKKIVSIGQFRPEKNHPLQLTSFAKFLKLVEKDAQNYVLVLVGSCRHGDDQVRVDSLRRLASDLNISDHIDFRLNVTFSELEDLFATSTVALHTMWNEHFGIGIVECMAAGLIMLAHRSGGPLADIVSIQLGNETGFLASTAEEYADTLQHIFCDLTPTQLELIRGRARESVHRFADSKFERSFLKCVRKILSQ